MTTNLLNLTDTTPEGGGGHAPPRSARLRGPPPPFSRATSTSARFARRPIRWNAPLSLRCRAPARPRLRPASRGSAPGRSSPPPPTPGVADAGATAALANAKPAPQRTGRQEPWVALAPRSQARQGVASHRANSRHLAASQRSLTRRLLLRSGSRSIPPTSALRLDSAPPPLRKTAETGTRQVAPPPPASASPVLAPETLASSLASAAAWSCAGPQVRLASGRAGQLVPAPLPPQPARPEASRSRPRAPRL